MFQKQIPTTQSDAYLSVEVAQLRSQLEQLQTLTDHRSREVEYYQQQAQYWQSLVVNQVRI